jgi:uncharacterized protein
MKDQGNDYQVKLRGKMNSKNINFGLLEKNARNAFHGAPPTHDFSHTERVLSLCLHISEHEKADKGILRAAALLHDIARIEADRDGVCHAELSAEIAGPLLDKALFPKNMKKEILHCIKTHRFRSNNPPQSIEAKILYDADKLDAIGAIGVCRAYSYGGENGQKLYDTFFPDFHSSENDESIKKITDHSQHTPVTEFRIKLSQIKNKLFTETAKNIAEKRHHFMLKFFNCLCEEIQGIR